MAEKIVSPGVFTDEIDQTFLPAAVAEIGAAVIGPTVKGPANVPTIVTSYSEYQQMFGDTFKSGSNFYQYLTSHTAREYLKHADKLTVVRVLDADYSSAESTIPSNAETVAATFASGTLTIADGFATAEGSEEFVQIGDTKFLFISGALAESTYANSNSSGLIFIESGSSVTLSAQNLRDAINNSGSLHGLNISASNSSGVLTLSGSVAGTLANKSAASSSAGFTFGAFAATGLAVAGGTDSQFIGTSFKLKTLSHGSLLNNSGSDLSGTNNILKSGSKDNIRWEVTNRNDKKGTFTLVIRRGDDSIKRKQTLETYNNLTLDPNSNDYIARRIGDQDFVLRDSGGTDPYLQLSGSYPNKSKYVRVSDIALTPDYLDENGDLRINSLSSSLPGIGSGSYHGSFTGGSDGYVGFDGLGNQKGGSGEANFYEKINSTNSQGYTLAASEGGTAYEDVIKVLKNQDEYDINLVLLPGLVDDISAHKSIIGQAIDMCEDRGDCFVIADPVKYASTITDATTQAEARDSNYAAMYWPWVQVIDDQTGTYRWVPPSVVMSGIFSFNDKVAQPWFAPAGLNRGGIDSAVQVERKLTHANRDTLYDSNVNPIATFPAQGVCAWGQKTLQKKASALDRINVRRLMIKVKKFIASSSRFLVFEQNTAATRRRFLNIANPYLEQVQSQSGLNAFRVVMDETNNTPDVVDRNILYGQIFLQPTRTAEFIVLDFTVQPTGATFPE